MFVVYAGASPKFNRVPKIASHEEPDAAFVSVSSYIENTNTRADLSMCVLSR